MSSSSEDEGDLDQIDLFHAQREKSALVTYGTSEGLSSSDEEEEEVMPLDLSSSAGDISGTDQLEDERDPLSLKTWGRKVATYYEEGEEGEGKSLDGELEEREALQLQTLQAGLLSPSDFDIPFPGIDQSPLSSEDMLIAADLANLDTSERDLFVGHNHPELPHIIAALRDSFSCALKDSSLLNNSISSSRMKTYLDVGVLLNLSYSLNLMYYLLLKADGVGVASHPVTSMLLLLQKLLGKLEKVDKLVERRGSLANRRWEHQPSVPILRGDKTACNERDEDALSFYRGVAAQKKRKRSGIKAAIPEDLQPLEGKRAITYQISRNKGLGVSGKRQLRNPRVKHRLKYKKALLKRKSQVLPVAREISRYAGEVTGIKAQLSRSTVIAP